MDVFLKKEDLGLFSLFFFLFFFGLQQSGFLAKWFWSVSFYRVKSFCSAPYMYIVKVKLSLQLLVSFHLRTFWYQLQKQPPEVFCKKSVLNYFAVFPGKHLSWSISLIDSFIKKRLQHSCFPVHIAKCLKTPILKNVSEWLLQRVGLGSNLNMRDFNYETIPFIDFVQKLLMQPKALWIISWK